MNIVLNYFGFKRKPEEMDDYIKELDEAIEELGKAKDNYTDEQSISLVEHYSSELKALRRVAK